VKILAFGGSYVASPAKYKENTSHTAKERQEVFTKHVSIKLGRFKKFVGPLQK
jgi:hypothetical protein